MAAECPAPSGHDARDRTAAIGRLLGDPVDLQVTLRLQATGRGLAWWGELPDGDRPAPGSKPFAWVRNADLERWNEHFDRSFVAVADRMAARDAERAQADSVAALAATVARNAATEAVQVAGQEIAREVTKAVVGKGRRRRQASAQPGPVIRHVNREALDRRAGQNGR
jgi:hypothetical protein